MGRNTGAGRGAPSGSGLAWPVAVALVAALAGGLLIAADSWPLWARIAAGVPAYQVFTAAVWTTVVRLVRRATPRLVPDGAAAGERG